MVVGVFECTQNLTQPKLDFPSFFWRILHRRPFKTPQETVPVSFFMMNTDIIGCKAVYLLMSIDIIGCIARRPLGIVEQRKMNDV
jgi:hypothetical protein